MIIENIRKSRITKWIIYLVIGGMVIVLTDRLVGIIYEVEIDKEFNELQENAIKSIQEHENKSEDEGVFYSQIDSLISQDQQEKAINMLYERIIEFPYEKSYLIHHIGLIYAFDGNIDSAKAKFSEAISLNSNYALAYVNRAICYTDLDSIDKAILDYKKAADLNWDYYYDLGLAQEKKGLHEDAIKSYQNSLKHSYYYGTECKRRIDSLEKILNSIQ